MAIFLEATPTTTSLDLVLNRAINGYYEQKIFLVYDALKWRSSDERKYKAFKSEYLNTVNAIQKEIKEAMSNEVFDDVKNLVGKKFERTMYLDDKITKFYSYPNKYCAYEDLKFFYDRITVIKLRLSSKF